MIGRLMDFLSGQAAPSTRRAGPDDDLHMAVAALLIEAAHMDSDFSVAERTVIERVLEERFDLHPDQVAELVAAAERKVKDATQLHPFTREICANLPPDMRSEIIEMLWRVAYQDGVLDPDEDAMIRHVANLIHVTDRERAMARQRALKK